MAKTGIESKDLKRILGKFNPEIKGRIARIARALSDTAEFVLTTTKVVYLTGKALRVQTGRLRSSVTKSRVIQVGHEMYINVGSNVVYGRFWELGFTHRSGKAMAPRPFLGPSFDDNRANIRRVLGKAGVIFQ